MRKFINFIDFMAKAYPKVIPGSEESQASAASSQRDLTRTVTFQVTDACNLACTYCYQTNKGTRRMSFETAKKFADNLISGDKNFDQYVNPERSTGLVVEFIGGEPFLEIDLIDRIVDYIREQLILKNHPWANKVCFSICSNGVLYRDERVQRFLQKNYDCVSFSVTVDGDKALHDSCRVFADGSPSYDLAADAALDWISRGYYMGSKITIAPDNLDHLVSAFKHFVSMGYEEINANCIYEVVWTTEQAQRFYKQLKEIADFLLADEKYRYLAFSIFGETIGKPMESTELQNWCGGTGSMLVCDPDGKLFPCIKYMESSLNGDQKPVSIVDVDNGLLATCEQEHCLECLNSITRRTQSTDECFYCPIAGGCSWCSAWNYQVYGTANKRWIGICEMHKARSLANTYYLTKYYAKYGGGNPVDLWVPKQWAIPIVGEQEYSMLVDLVRDNGGIVNSDKTMIKE